MEKQYKHDFTEGFRNGVPIFLGYLSVSFGFGVKAVSGGLDWLTALLISFTNVTSAGQLQGLSIILASGGLMEMLIAEFVINVRYSLMSIVLTQKLDRTMSTLHRMIIGFGITDEVFAVANAKSGSVGRRYMYGLILLPLAGWSLGTLMGALAGTIMPPLVQDSMGILLYAMFIAIVLPPAGKSRAICFCVSLAAACSCLFSLVPFFSFMSSGYSVVASALIASVPAALLFPVKEEEA